MKNLNEKYEIPLKIFKMHFRINYLKNVIINKKLNKFQVFEFKLKESKFIDNLIIKNAFNCKYLGIYVHYLIEYIHKI